MCACVQLPEMTLLLSGSEKRFGPRFVSAHASSRVSSQLGVSKLRLRSTPEGRKLSDNTPKGRNDSKPKGQNDSKPKGHHDSMERQARREAGDGEGERDLE